MQEDLDYVASLEKRIQISEAQIKALFQLHENRGNKLLEWIDKTEKRLEKLEDALQAKQLDKKEQKVESELEKLLRSKALEPSICLLNIKNLSQEIKELILRKIDETWSGLLSHEVRVVVKNIIEGA